jgi:hypothetical protein
MKWGEPYADASTRPIGNRAIIEIVLAKGATTRKTCGVSAGPDAVEDP